MQNAITITIPNGDFSAVALDAFPVVEDFAVELREYGEGGQHVELTSAAHGRLAHFPAWDHADRDLRHFTPMDVPFGSLAVPFEDRDEAWRILIFENGGYVHVLEGDAPNDDTFSRFFRVPRDRYIEAWAALMALFNPVEDV
jgi:hypothetical protein